MPTRNTSGKYPGEMSVPETPARWAREPGLQNTVKDSAPTLLEPEFLYICAGTPAVKAHAECRS